MHKNKPKINGKPPKLNLNPYHRIFFWLCLWVVRVSGAVMWGKAVPHIFPLIVFFNMQQC